jgi:catechol 2,3-dioxygenase-like lactoylglutathione lyase family enzyme
MTTRNLRAVEIKAFVPARDFDRSKQFYADLGFEIPWSSEDLAYVRYGDTSFLLQRFSVKEHSENFQMHLLVEDVDAWWEEIRSRGIAAKYGVRIDEPSDQPWAMRDFPLVDPSGVLWRIAQNLPKG